MRILALVYLFHFLRHGIIFPIIPLYAQNMGASASMIGTVVSSFSFLSLFLAIPVGGWTDKWSKKQMLLLGVLCNILYCFLLMTAQSIIVLILAQLFGGLGFLLLIVATQTYISIYARGRQMEKGFSRLAFAAAIGQALGPYLGGWVLSVSDFKTVFFLALVLSFTGLALFGLEEEKAVQGQGKAGFDKLYQVRSFLSNFSMLGIFLFTFMVVFVVSLRTSFLPVLLKEKGLLEDRIGLLISVIACSMTLVRFFMDRILASFSRNWLMASSLILIGIGVSLLPIFDFMVMLTLLLAVLGTGFGISQPLSMVMISEHSPDEHSGLALGLRFTTITLGTFLSPIIFGWIISVLGMESAFYAAALFIFLAGIFIFYAIHTSLKSRVS